MAALDLDPEEVSQTEPRTFQDLQRVCTLCDDHRRCARDLSRNSAIPAWKDYCPNAETLMALSAMPRCSTNQLGRVANAPRYSRGRVLRSGSLAK